MIQALPKVLPSFLVCLALMPSALAYVPFHITGLLKDVFHDPTDSAYLFFYVESTNGSYYAALNKNHFPNVPEIENSIGAQIDVQGQLVGRNDLPTRPYSSKEIRITANTNGFAVICSQPMDVFGSPNEKILVNTTPDTLPEHRFLCVSGKVLATWNGDSVLLQTKEGAIIEAELRQPDLPRCGETVDIAGLPETTLYNLRLNRAVCRIVGPQGGPDETASEMSARQIVMDRNNKPGMNALQHGKLIRIRGIVRCLPNAASGSHILYLEDNGFIVPVNAEAAATALTDVSIGCTLEVTGICVLSIDVWRPNAVFPRIRGYSLVTRTPDDIRVLAHPPWLTPRRMAVVLAILAAVLLAILFWTYALRVQSERRGRQLAREQLRHAEADLKVHERTRLAVELHDALSQNLAGVALQLKTVAALADADPKAAKDRLAIADRSLLSCREDLRNCLHDLRSDALEEKTMDAAIQKSLAPYVDEAAVTVRFNVPRERFSEKSAHALICIVRELALNAIRHGKATAVKVAGATEGGKILVSVRDNGCGFDPATRPGVREGHFGLQGVQERILALGGHFTLDSTPGNGTRASFSINLPSTEDPAHG